MCCAWNHLWQVSLEKLQLGCESFDVCQQLAHHCVLHLKVKVEHIMMLCYVIQKSQSVWQSVRAVKFPFSEKKRKEKKKLQCGSPTEPPHNFVIYSIFIFSLNVKQDLRKLGVVRGFGTNEINGLHPTFHNIIKSEMFWTENLLLDYKVSLIVLPPSPLTLLQTTASKSSVTFMS